MDGYIPFSFFLFFFMGLYIFYFSGCGTKIKTKKALFMYKRRFLSSPLFLLVRAYIFSFFFI